MICDTLRYMQLWILNGLWHIKVKSLLTRLHHVKATRAPAASHLEGAENSAIGWSWFSNVLASCYVRSTESNK